MDTITLIRKYLKHIICDDSEKDIMFRVMRWDAATLKELQLVLRDENHSIQRAKAMYNEANDNNKHFWKEVIANGCKYRRFLKAYIAYRESIQ